MLNKRWYHIHSHQHCPSSGLRPGCPSIRVSVLRATNGTASLHTFKLVLWVSRWESNAWLTCHRTVLPTCCPCVRNLKRSRQNLDLRQSVTACLCNYLPSVAFSVAREWQQLWTKRLCPSIWTSAFQLEIHGAAGGLLKVEGKRMVGGVWKKNGGSGKEWKNVKKCILWLKSEFRLGFWLIFEWGLDAADGDSHFEDYSWQVESWACNICLLEWTCNLQIVHDTEHCFGHISSD